MAPERSFDQTCQLSFQKRALNLTGGISLAIKCSDDLGKVSEPPGSRQVERTFHGSHSLMHGATKDMAINKSAA
jgi:hypothetical protein